MQENYMVTQSNNLIEARHLKPLTAREQKIVLTMVSMIQPTDKDFMDYRISIREFHEMLGLSGREHYTEIKEIAKELMSKSVEIPKDDGGWILANWISSADYIKGEGVIALSFSPKLLPYLLQLKNAFTSYRLSNILSLKSTYSIRLYELMKKWQHLGRWECPVESLREKLGATTKTYSLYGNFKNRVLSFAINEINEKTDLHITFKEIKKGRKVDKIEFSIQHFKEKEIRLPKKQKEESNATSVNEIRERLNGSTKGYLFDKAYFADIYSTALTIWQERAGNELKMLVEYVNAESSINKPLGFIKSKLKIALQLHFSGEKISFSDLEGDSRSTGRVEVVPDWFSKRREKKEEFIMSAEEEENLKHERVGLYRKLGLSEEEIVQREKEKDLIFN
ncbi:replication initiation protein [Paenisporosarcina sp. OV554]|uniref:replication initiation protein n=1 Tax=Paenisporosarcina sp. OV554 TaxID=2135694 RepID=UPI000D48845A|nr:replication initiation protein [Paenisporosarcina sp. OV554]PUB08201.1 replication initiator protein [Paenisporosarcina sp. OV554]